MFKAILAAGHHRLDAPAVSLALVPAAWQVLLLSAGADISVSQHIPGMFQPRSHGLAAPVRPDSSTAGSSRGCAHYKEGFSPPSYYIRNMAKYTTVAQTGEPGFEVRIVGRDGVNQTILGFKTKDEAEAWIKRDEQLERAANPPLA